MKSNCQLTVIGGFLLLPSLAQADPIDKSVRLSLEGTLFGSTTVTTGSGLAETETTVSQFGVLAAGGGVGLDYAFSEHFLFGARFLVNESQAESEVGGTRFKQSQGTRLIAPNIEGVLGSPESTVRPFLFGLVGLQNTSTEADGETQADVTATVAGFGGGIHIFAANGFSISPTLGIQYGSGETELVNGNSVDSSETSILGVVRFSGWIGGGPSESATEEPSEPGFVDSPTESAQAQREPAWNSGTLSLNEDEEIYFRHQPWENGMHVDLDFVFRRPDPELRGCSVVKAQAGSRTIRLPRAQPVVRGSASLGIRTSASLHTLRDVAESDPSAFRICDTILSLGMPAKQRLLEFVEGFERAARSAGTWRDRKSETVDTPEPASTPDAEPPVQNPEEAQDSADTDETTHESDASSESGAQAPTQSGPAAPKGPTPEPE